MMATEQNVHSLKTRTMSRKWISLSGHPKSADDLAFTSRDSSGRIVWWDVTPPKTDYYHAHEMLGRAYAFDLLDLIHNQAANESSHIVRFISTSIARWLATPAIAGTAATGMGDGFFDVLSEFIVTGKVDR